jgi:hypothetical protein
MPMLPTDCIQEETHPKSDTLKLKQPTKDANFSKLFATISKISPSPIRPSLLQSSMITKAPSTGLNHSLTEVSLLTSTSITWQSENLNTAARLISSTTLAPTTLQIFSPRNLKTRPTSPYYSMWSYRSDLRGGLESLSLSGFCPNPYPYLALDIWIVVQWKWWRTS